MIVEMLLLLLIALAVFAYVLAPIVLPRQEAEAAEDAALAVSDEAPEPASAEKQPVHDLS